MNPAIDATPNDQVDNTIQPNQYRTRFEFNAENIKRFKPMIQFAYNGLKDTIPGLKDFEIVSPFYTGKMSDLIITEQT